MRKKRTRRRSSKTGAKTKLAMTLSVAKEATTASAGDNRACSDGRDRNDKYGGGKGTRSRTGCGDFSEKGSFCNGSRSG